MTGPPDTAHAPEIVGTAGIVGAGVMGAGIAQVALEAGWEAILYDVDEIALERGRARVREGLARRAAKLDLDADSIDDWVEGRLGRLREARTLDAVAFEADLVIESALEDLALKQTIFRALDEDAAPEAILATNTSALSVTAIASATQTPERVIGLHFFNPVPLMALVEVATTPFSDPSVVSRATAVMAAWGKTPVGTGDSPGFIVNRVNRPYTIEALRMLEAGAASVEAIDEAMHKAGFPMGPFELIDLAGADINHAAAQGIWEGLDRPDRLRPSEITERLVAEGRLGRKSGSGFYRYDDGRRGEVDPEFAAPQEASSALDPATIRDRILRAIDDEASLAVEEGVASQDAVDLALRLGAGHPAGPFERRRAAKMSRD